MVSSSRHKVTRILQIDARGRRLDSLNIKKLLSLYGCDSKRDENWWRH